MRRTPLFNDVSRIRWAGSFFLAVALHFAVFSLIPLFFSKNNRPQAYVVQWGNPQRQKIRTVGDKKGESLSVLRPPIILPKKAPIRPRRSSKKQKALSAPKLSLEQLKSLKAGNGQDRQGLGKVSFPMGKSDVHQNVPLERSSRFEYRPSKRLQHQIYQDLKQARRNEKKNLGVLKHSHLEISFAAPKGVDISELNELEQIFYGFNLRVYEVYVSSLITTNINYINQNPHAFRRKNPWSSEILKAKVRFDQLGNMERINVLNWSHNDHIQNIFLRSLKNIKSIPNPPRAFVQNKKHFNLYFNLIVNGK